MDKTKRLNKMLIINLGSLVMMGYFATEFFSGTWFNPTVITIAVTWAVGIFGYWGYANFLKKEKLNNSVINVVNTGAIFAAFFAVFMRIVWLGGTVTYANSINNDFYGIAGLIESATGNFMSGMTDATAILLIITSLATAAGIFMTTKSGKSFDGNEYRYTRNLGLGLLGMFTLLSMQAHFAPGVFGLVNNTTGWTGLVGGWAAHLLMALAMLIFLTTVGTYVYFMVKKPVFKKAGEKPAFVTTFTVLIIVMLTIYVLDKYVITKMYPIGALDSSAWRTVIGFDLPVDWDLMSNLEKLQWIQINGIPRFEFIIGPGKAQLGYNISMFTLTTFIGIGIVNAPAIYWQKKVLHAH